jgi:hypothetical protein
MPDIICQVEFLPRPNQTNEPLITKCPILSL